MPLNKTRAFLESVRSFARQEVPPHVIERAKESLLDYIGVTYAGIAEMGAREQALLAGVSGESGAGLAIGIGRSLPLKEAVFLNGLNAHALDFDDGVNAGIIHLGSPVFSLLIPLAATSGVSGEALLGAAVTGYEAAWTLAHSIQPGHKLMGYHATSTCGTLGAVLAACQMLELGEEETFQALGIACVSAGGTLKVLEDASQLKPYNVARASMTALTSLQMARAGYRGPDDAMSGERGFLRMMTGRDDVGLAGTMVDGRYAIMRTYTKPYAACRYCHPSIEAAAMVGEELGRDDSAVESVEVRTYELAVGGHDHVEVTGAGSAKMSIPFGVASGFLYGKAGLAEYTESAARSERTLGLARKVSVSADDEMSVAFPEKTAAEVSFILSGGRVVTRRVDHPRGEPENPLGRQDVCGKFREAMAFAGKSHDLAESVIEDVFDVETHLDGLLSLLGGDR